MPNCPVVRLNRFVLAMAGVLALMAAMGVHAEQIFSFVDEAGVVHLSNVPNDPRYQITAQISPSAAVDVTPAEPLPPLAIEDEAPTPEGSPRFTPITIIPHPPVDR